MYMYFKCSFNYLKVFKLLEFEKCIGKENRSQFYSQIDCLSTCKYKVLQNKCSKISNTGCLPKMPRQTVQTQIRLLLKKQSDQGLRSLFAFLTSVFRFFVNSSPENKYFLWERRKVFKTRIIFLRKNRSDEMSPPFRNRKITKLHLVMVQGE